MSSARGMGNQTPASRGYGPNYGMVTWEKKAVDTAQSNNYGTTPAITLLNGIATGTGINGRIGSKVNLTSIQVRVTVSNPISTSDISGGPYTSSGQTVRMLIVADLQSNGALPAASDILQVDQNAAVSVVSPMNLANRDRFRVIKDKIFNLGPIAYDNADVEFSGTGPQIIY